MSKKGQQSGRAKGAGSRPNAVAAAKRGGPGVGFWVTLGAAAVIGIVALTWLTSRPKATASKIDPTLPALKAQGYVIGSPTAPIEVIEFADFECPGCGQFSLLTEPDIRLKLVNTGQIRMRFMDFPLPMHKNTWDASLAAACANDQGKFWEMHDQIFLNQDRWNGEATSRPRGPLGDIAQRVGLDMSKYGACMDAETHRAQIQANLAEGERRQVGRTPTFIIGTQMIPGAPNFDQFKKIVEDETQKVRATAPAAGATKAADTTAKKAP